MALSLNEQYLCNFDCEVTQYDSDLVRDLWSHKWVPKSEEIVQRILKTELKPRALTEVIKSMLNNRREREDLLHLALGSLLIFCEQNWCNPKTQNFQLFSLWPENVNASLQLQLDSEVAVNTSNPELLLLSMQVLEVLYSLEESFLYLWWYFRCKVIHQRILEDASATLYEELEGLIEKLDYMSVSLKDRSRLRIVLYLEIAEAYLLYGRTQEAQEFIDISEKLSGFEMNLVGALGKRTAFQKKYISQLSLSVKLAENIERLPAASTHGSTVLPPLVELEDDVRLERIQFVEELKPTELSSIEQTVCFGYIKYLNKHRPADSLKNEEILPFLNGLLSCGHGPWSVRVAAILMKCKIESADKRAVERALKQCEAIVNLKLQDESVYRLSYLWASGLQPTWQWEHQLADLCLSLGLVKAALEIYLKLQLWEEVIACYTIMEMRHKAVEVIEQQIEIKPTPKLYCLLGDATDNVEWYEKAWEFSGLKSSRAQRHWGNYLFNRKEYAECMQHFQKSLEINFLQEQVWSRLGFAALAVEDWETAAAAYRHYTCLEPGSYEIWNNLAKAYVELGLKHRAYKALKEAVRHNYDNWKLWDNIVTIGMDTGHYVEVVYGCNRILNLVGDMKDDAIVGLLIKAALEGGDDADGNTNALLKQEVTKLLGRVCNAKNKPEMWSLYADMTGDDYVLKTQRLLNAYRGYKHKLGSPDVYSKIVNCTIALIKSAKKARQDVKDGLIPQADSMLSSARLAGQATLKSATDQAWPVPQTKLQELQTSFEDITNYIKSLA